MKILHTSDWHLGRSLFGRGRYTEFESFLNWLLDTVSTHQVEALIVAGDVFDSGTPSNRAQQLYYSFLQKISATCCRHIVLIGGNHDSPTLLEAPRELLRFFQVHVIGSAQENRSDEVLILKNSDGHDELIVCAVPYLRDRDIRSARAGEEIEDKHRKLLQGITDHYAEVGLIAKKARQGSAGLPPVVATGHLFAAGGTRVEGDGVRDLYVGSLVHVNGAVLDQGFDYVALGHLHSPQCVGGHPHIRYSGSPLPMSFSEAEKDKSVVVVSCSQGETHIETITVPLFQRLTTLRGDLDSLLDRIRSLKAENESIWLEIIYTGKELVPNLQAPLHEAVENSNLEILRILNQRLVHSLLEPVHPDENLEDMTCESVFQRCLEVHETPEHQRNELTSLFRLTLQELEEDDRLAE